MRTTLGLVAGLILAGCGDASRAPAFGFRGMVPGMNATDLQSAAAGVGVEGIRCQRMLVEGLAADRFCFTPDSAASSINITALIQSADSMVSYLAIREAMSDPATAYDALSRLWGAPDTAISTGRRWTRGRWVATADTGENILTVWLSDTATARLVVLAGREQRLRAMGADTLPFTTDASAVVEGLRADSVGQPPPRVVSELSEAPTVVRCDKVPPPANLASRTGSVLLAFIVDSMGRVEPQSVRVLEATYNGLVQAAAATVRSCTLRPGRQAGRAVRSLVQQRVAFEARR